jgi:hypothetical protein
VNAPLGTPCALDADLCTFDRCDGNDICEHVFEPHPTTMVPVASKNSTMSLVGGGDPAHQKLKWTWTHGPAFNGFSIFATGANYALCLYDDTGLAGRFDIPAGGTCGYIGGSCWKFSSNATNTKSTLKYFKRDGAVDGIQTATFKTGGTGKTQVKIVGGGANLPLPALPITVPLRAQLITEDFGRTVCVDATYSSGVKANTAAAFKAHSD